jgi:hypothetical protein
MISNHQMLRTVCSPPLRRLSLENSFSTNSTAFSASRPSLPSYPSLRLEQSISIPAPSPSVESRLINEKCWTCTKVASPGKQAYHESVIQSGARRSRTTRDYKETDITSDSFSIRPIQLETLS